MPGERIKRNIKCEYFYLEHENINGHAGHAKGKKFDFVTLINTLLQQTLVERVHENNKLLVRLEDAKFLQEGYWVANFIKYRTNNPPSKATREKPKEDIALDDDEYVNEDMNVLFDPYTKAFMIQRNKMSLSLGDLAHYFACKWEKLFGERMILKWIPIQAAHNSDVLRKGTVRQIYIAVANPDMIKQRSVKSILDSAASFNGTNVEIKIKRKERRGKKEIEGLAEAEVGELLRDLTENGEFYSKAEFQYYDNEHTNIQYMDLLENKLTSFLEVYVAPKTPLRAEYIYDIMIDEFKEKAGYIVSLRNI